MRDGQAICRRPYQFPSRVESNFCQRNRLGHGKAYDQSAAMLYPGSSSHLSLRRLWLAQKLHSADPMHWSKVGRCLAWK